MTDTKLQILAIIDHYLPGHKAGGPTRSIANLVQCLGNELAFFVMTSDRDFKSHAPYSDIKTGEWQSVGKAQVVYLSPQEKDLWHWQHHLSDLDYDVLYLNGFFSRLTIKTLVLRRLQLIPSRPVILAPRGEFSLGALALKRTKKVFYLALSRWMNLYQGVTWQASSKYEQQDIVGIVRDVKAQIMVTPNIVSSQSITPAKIFKETNTLKLVFLSRISPKKNLDYALRILTSLRGDIVFDIYGPLEDIAYWQACQSIIARMPKHIQVNYLGEVTPDRVIEILSQYHLFFFPTQGENFGHVISESLRAGCPVLISDQTPWQGLEDKKAGWVIPLSQPEQFRVVLNQVAEMDDAAFQAWSSGARAYGEQKANDPAVVEANRRLFMSALNQK